MKKAAVFPVLLFAFLCGSLNAQAYREAKIYVPPLDGVGYIDDMAHFYKQITGEIVMQYRSLAKARVLSDYVITGTVMPIAEAEIEMPPDSAEGDEYVLFVELFDNALGEAIGEQYITYGIPDDNTKDALGVILYNLLSAIPDIIELYGAEDEWRNKFIYTGLAFLWTPRVYNRTFQSVNIAGVGAELIVDIHILRLLSVRFGAELVPDWVVVYSMETSHQDLLIDFPVAVSFVLRPLEKFMLQPYLGVSLNLSLQGITRPYPFSWNAGIELGIKVGLGILTIDPRFSMDFGKSYIMADGLDYWRSTMHLGIGYRLGFMKRLL